MITEKIKAVHEICCSRVLAHVAYKATPENIVDKQSKIYEKEGINSKTLNVVFALQMVPLLFMMVCMGIFSYAIDQVNNVLSSPWNIITNIVIFILIAVMFFYTLSKDFFGLQRKIMLRSVKKGLKKHSKEYYGMLLFLDDALKYMVADEEVLAFIEKEEIFNEEELRFLKIQGDGKIKLLNVSLAVRDLESYEKFKEKVKQLS